jgi:hypothetical protein
MPSPKVIQLRQILADKFPGLRLKLDESLADPPDQPQTLSPLADLFENRLAKGTLNEVVAGGDKIFGSATLMRELIHHAANKSQIIALVDGSDSFDVTGVSSTELLRLLWVRCVDADKALKATDLLLRDGNLPLVWLDLKLNPEAQLRKIPPTIWYRFQRLIETTATICVVTTPRPLIAPAQTRITLQSGFSFADLERDATELVRELKWEIADPHHAQKIINLQSA